MYLKVIEFANKPISPYISCEMYKCNKMYLIKYDGDNK